MRLEPSCGIYANFRHGREDFIPEKGPMGAEAKRQISPHGGVAHSGSVRRIGVIHQRPESKEREPGAPIDFSLAHFILTLSPERYGPFTRFS
jgi:hypothetical protein